jgi:hypothetical protein
MIAAAFAASLAAGSAHAEGSFQLTVDWSKLDAVLRDGSASFLPRESANSTSFQPVPTAGDRAHPAKWFGFSPQLSLVARDWSGARAIFGQLALSDQLRLSRSSRMIVSRVRLVDGRVAPFVHGGLGQWRVDTDLLPVLPRDVEVAGQFGAGVEVSFSRTAVVAVEGDHTILIRQDHEPQMVCSPHLWGSFLAARVLF